MRRGLADLRARGPRRRRRTRTALPTARSTPRLAPLPSRLTPRPPAVLAATSMTCGPGDQGLPTVVRYRLRLDEHVLRDRRPQLDPRSPTSSRSPSRTIREPCLRVLGADRAAPSGRRIARILRGQGERPWWISPRSSQFTQRWRAAHGKRGAADGRSPWPRVSRPRLTAAGLTRRRSSWSGCQGGRRVTAGARADADTAGDLRGSGDSTSALARGGGARGADSGAR